MVEDFRQAAERHWKDGELLKEQNRIDNADQLFGLSAECALKHALVQLGAFREESHRTHVNVLWNKIQPTFFHRAFPGLPRILNGNPCFADWNIEQRYHGTGTVTPAAVQAHRRCASRLLSAVGLARG